MKEVLMKQLSAKIWNPEANDTFADSVLHFFRSSDSLGVYENDRYTVFPGFCDVHVHFREPGFSYKETIRTGSLAAAHGGYTAVCPMPNLNPVPDSKEHLQQELEIIRRDAVVDVRPYAAITVGQAGKELADLEGMAADCVAFSDDGHGVQDAGMMKEAMQRAKKLGKIIVAHCEVNELLHGGYIHDGRYAKEHGHVGISSESEWKQVERDILLSKETGCAYHVCHISTKESVELVRQAKKDGIDVTCETGPHYLIFDDSDLQESGWWKMNPPLRDASDRKALLEGVLDGTIDCLATDHAPHSAEEKSRGLKGSAMGIVGLETAFAAAYTYLVQPGIVPMDTILKMLIVNPRHRFNIPLGTDFSIWDLNSTYTVDPETFLSRGRATPFAGKRLTGECVAAVYGGRIAWQKGMSSENR